MTAAAAAGATPFENRSLFSDHYLTARLPTRPEWTEDVTGAFATAHELWRQKRGLLAGLNEAQTEEEWIRPLLRDVLGWEFQVQTSVTGVGGSINRPDYSLFATPDDKAAATPLADDPGAFYGHVAAVADAKYYDRPLDRTVADARELTNANPSFQIVAYLVATGVEWGILTNGREWRLYSTRARSRVDTYYAVDLARVLSGSDETAFRYFFLFFRAAAFRPDPDSGRSFLEAVHEGSLTYGAELEARLKGLVFDEIFGHLAAGFVAWRRQQGDAPESDAELREIYGGTLRLLYRLLFLLHAEARGLLPVADSDGYRQYSLTRIKRTVAGRIDSGAKLSTVSDDLWNDLAALFRIIDLGDPGLDVPRYNGGLFRHDHPDNAFFETHRIADAYLLPALDRLARADGRHFIDYKALNVEQLGSIYEGLLEFHLRLADEDLGVVRSKGKEVYRPLAAVEKPLRVVPKGEPFLVNDRGERKATGSYYTPHFIVEYIVAETVGPIVAEREARFRALMTEIAPRRKRLAATQEKLRGMESRRDGTATRWTNEANGLRRELARLEPEAVETLLGIRVCDPAMGSGHFLVHATDWLTERLIAILTDFPENPILARLAEIRDDIVANLAEQGIRVDPAALRDANLLKRMVMKRCVYGVDLNPMATELAKLSLWLDSFTIGAPLSFLDHHLKTGNSLVGTTVEDLRDAVETGDEGQFDVFGGPFAGLLKATALMRDVATTTDATFAEVAQSAERYAEFERAMRPYKRLLDVWLARRFGIRRAEELATLHGAQVLALSRGGDAEGVGAGFRGALDAAAEQARELRFFHWDLEFPEVFVDLELARWKENPGFDAVIGNPPYVRQEEVAELKPYFSHAFADAYHGVADLFVYFFAQGLRLTRHAGRLAFISSNSWLRANYASPLRHVLRTKATVETIVDLGDNRVFTDAPDVYPAILAVRRALPAAEHAAQAATFDRGEGIGAFAEQLREKLSSVAIYDQSDSGWQLGDEAGRRLFRKLMGSGTMFGEAVNGEIYRGILSGLTAAFVLDQQLRDEMIRKDVASGSILKPMLRGQDLRRWYSEDEGQWLIVVPAGWTRSVAGKMLPEQQGWDLFRQRYPAVAEHLAQYAEKARKRADQGDYWWELRPCAYYEAFSGAKIFWPDIGKSPRFVWDAADTHISNTAYFTPAASPYRLGILASRVTWFTIGKLSQSFGERAGSERYRLFTQSMSQLPIPDAPAPEREALGTLAMAITEQARSRYELHQQTRHRIQTDLGGAGGKLSRKLTEWWTLDFAGFRREAAKTLRQEIPLRERDEWEHWLAERRQRHDEHTAEIVRLETELNRRVYGLFDLTAAEIRIVEESTKYEYGKV
ncbi:MAG: Eco57I restriction-modification methylase domain-containing protein [Longimicrobiaceae bacterium]